MPSTIKSYAIDYNNNSDIELKKLKTHLLQQQIILKNRMEKNEPCFYKIELKNQIPSKYLNSSGKKN